uniref:IQ motif containing K n=1 Tax=Ciona savignyi TaxID=51511 RepID=H2ZQ21_CIOSA
MTQHLSSPKVYGEKKVKSLWEQICEEFAAQKADYDDHDIDDSSSIATDVTQYSASRHTPIVYGKMVHKPQIDSSISHEFDPALSHPAAVGLTMLSKPPSPPSPPPIPPPDPKTCSPQEFLENHIFPTLIPGMIEMLNQAKHERCFERKRTRFNACDFLTEYLYKNNPKVQHRKESLWEIPFVKSWNNEHPREPLPLSLQWSEEEAAIKIQSFFRGFLVRNDPEVTELRAWQREWREENNGIRHKVEQFWEEQETKSIEAKSGRSSRNSKHGKSPKTR